MEAEQPASVAAAAAAARAMPAKKPKVKPLPRVRGVPRYTAYNVFVKHEATKGLHLPAHEMAQKWNVLPEAEKKAYKEQARLQTKDAHERHGLEMARSNAEVPDAAAGLIALGAKLEEVKQLAPEAYAPLTSQVCPLTLTDWLVHFICSFAHGLLFD